MSYGSRRKVGHDWQPFMAGILFSTQQLARNLEKRVAVLESLERPIEQVAWVETADGPRRMVVSFLSPDEKVSLGLRGLFG